MHLGGGNFSRTKSLRLQRLFFLVKKKTVKWTASLEAFDCRERLGELVRLLHEARFHFMRLGELGLQFLVLV